MSSNPSHQGSCLCQSVKLNAPDLKKNLGACHCGMCRKWSGGPFLALDCGTNVQIEGEEFVAIYSSSDWAERAFCKKCGSNLFYRLKSTGQVVASSELFENQTLNFDHQIFVDEKPEYYAFENETHKMTGAEVFAAYSEPEKSNSF